MAAGALALVLHAHLPYGRSREPGSLEEDWFFQALVESYLPLLVVLERCRQRKGVNPRLSMGLSPTLLSLLTDPVLLERFSPWVEQRCQLLQRASPEEQPAAEQLLRARLDAVGPDGGATGGAGMGVGMGMGLLRGVRPQGMLFSSDRDPFDLIEPDEGADDEDGRDRDPEVGTSLPPRALSRPLSVLR